MKRFSQSPTKEEKKYPELVKMRSTSGKKRNVKNIPKSSKRNSDAKRSKFRKGTRKRSQFSQRKKFGSSFQVPGEKLRLSEANLQFYGSNKKIPEKMLFQGGTPVENQVIKSTAPSNMIRMARLEQARPSSFLAQEEDFIEDDMSEESTLKVNNIRSFKSRFNFSQK